MSEPEYQVVVSPDEQQRADELGEELPSALPVLPLKETVVFPDSMTPLAIGQERSVRLIDAWWGATGCSRSSRSATRAPRRRAGTTSTRSGRPPSSTR